MSKASKVCEDSSRETANEGQKINASGNVRFSTAHNRSINNKCRSA